jgi:hypothetical protein
MAAQLRRRGRVFAAIHNSTGATNTLAFSNPDPAASINIGNLNSSR